MSVHQQDLCYESCRRQQKIHAIVFSDQETAGRAYVNNRLGKRKIFFGKFSENAKNGKLKCGKIN